MRNKFLLQITGLIKTYPQLRQKPKRIIQQIARVEPLSIPLSKTEPVTKKHRALKTKLPRDLLQTELSQEKNDSVGKPANLRIRVVEEADSTTN